MDWSNAIENIEERITEQKNKHANSFSIKCSDYVPMYGHTLDEYNNLLEDFASQIASYFRGKKYVVAINYSEGRENRVVVIYFNSIKKLIGLSEEELFNHRLVTIKNTGTDYDGTKALVVGVASERIFPGVQNFILIPEHKEESYKYDCISLPNYCLEIEGE